jgi:hypothetical protein
MNDCITARYGLAAGTRMGQQNPAAKMAPSEGAPQGQ